MFSNEELIQLALNELPSVPTKKPWMTAESLVKRILKNKNHIIEEEILEKALEYESQCRGRSIRYSMYPSARSLRILWGAVSSVNERSMSSLVLNEDGEQKETSALSINNEHIVFISHNNKDKDNVVNLCVELESAGIPTWIFETKIQEGETFIHEVRSAIDRSPVCILYLSYNSLGSTWVRKEVLNARGGVRLVVNAANEDLLRYIMQLDTPPTEIPSNLLKNCKTDMQKDNARHLLVYIYDCFIKNNNSIYIHGDDAHSCDIKKLIMEIQKKFNLVR